MELLKVIKENFSEEEVRNFYKVSKKYFYNYTHVLEELERTYKIKPSIENFKDEPKQTECIYESYCILTDKNIALRERLNELKLTVTDEVVKSFVSKGLQGLLL